MVDSSVARSIASEWASSPVLSSSASFARSSSCSARCRASRMALAFWSATERSSRSSSSCSAITSPSAFAASAVPSTRARILANAVSRVVDVSSLKGEKPQSSVVPSCATGMYRPPRGRGRGPPRASRCAGRSARRRRRRRAGPAFRCSRMIFSTRAAVPLAGQRDVEVAGLQLEQAGQQLRVVDVGAVRGIAVAARAGVHADPLRAPSAEKRDSARLLRSMKLLSRCPEGSTFIDEAAFGEVDLHRVRALLQAAADLGLVLAQQVVDELLARIARDPVGRIHEAQRRGRDDRLLHRHRRVALRDLEEAVGVAPVAKRAVRQPRHAPDVPRREGNLEAVGRRVRQPVHGVGPEVVVLPLLAVGDDGRARRLEPLHGVADRRLVERVEARIVGALSGEGLDELRRSRDAADRLGGIVIARSETRSRSSSRKRMVITHRLSG